MVEVLTNGQELALLWKNNVYRDKESLEAGDCICMLSYNIWITKMGNIQQHHYVTKRMTQAQMTDAFTEHVLTLWAHLPGNGMDTPDIHLICYVCPRDVNNL